jgi:hypothetical protein
LNDRILPGAVSVFHQVETVKALHLFFHRLIGSNVSCKHHPPSAPLVGLGEFWGARDFHQRVGQLSNFNL